jgi:hypothetical protein
MSQFLHAKQILAAKFGRPASRWNFDSYSGTPVLARGLPDFNAGDALYYADSRLWTAARRRARADFWMVFKNERDRTLAMLLLG